MMGTPQSPPLKEILQRTEAAKRTMGEAPEQARATFQLACDTIRDEIEQSTNPGRISELQRILAQIEGLLVDMRPLLPACTFADVIGMEDVKKVLRSALVTPMVHPSLYQPPRTPPRSLLLFGPPGTGKTLLARAAAGESQAELMPIKPSDIMSKWLGDSEARVGEFFRQARAKKRVIMFIDEIEALCPARIENEAVHRVVTQFLSEIDGATSNLQPGMFFLAATNHPELLDSAMQRRFNRRIYVRLPSADERMRMLRATIGGDHTLSDADFEWIVRQTVRFSGSEMRDLVHDCAMEPVRELADARWFRRADDKWHMCTETDAGAEPKQLLDLPDGAIHVRPVARSDFETCLKNIRPVATDAQLANYERFGGNK